MDEIALRNELNKFADFLSDEKVRPSNNYRWWVKDGDKFYSSKLDVNTTDLVNRYINYLNGQTTRASTAGSASIPPLSKT